MYFPFFGRCGGKYTCKWDKVLTQKHFSKQTVTKADDLFYFDFSFPIRL